MLKTIEVGDIYSYKQPGINGVFTVKVIERMKYSGFLVEVIDCTAEQAKILKESDFKILARGSLLTEVVEEVVPEEPVVEEVWTNWDIEIGQIYFCTHSKVKGTFEVQILARRKRNKYLVRIIRCTVEQRIILKKYGTRFVVKEKQLIEKSKNFL